jgi:triphosphoribosyl-dephospho-CoA synthase
MTAIVLIKKCYQQACEIELQAFKPGNVSVYAAGHNMTVKDFQLSASVSATPITNPHYSLGERIYYAVKATHEAVGCNTNLGIILLCAPIIQALLQLAQYHCLKNALTDVLQTTTIEDADWAFQAIALANPGGLGASKQADVHAKATVTLTAAMNIAQSKDRIALQYATNFKDIFDFALLRYNESFAWWGDLNWSAVAVYSALLSQYPDSHVERKHGCQYNKLIQRKMLQVNQLLSETNQPELSNVMLSKIDNSFKQLGINPGTTADITVATIFLFLAQRMLNE